MMHPVELADFFVTFLSSATIILCGALYAILFAWARARNMPQLMPLAYAAYAVLVVSVAALGNAAHLFGSYFWTSVAILMLAGYLVAPHIVWHLCVSNDAVSDGEVFALAPAVLSECCDPNTRQRPLREETS